MNNDIQQPLPLVQCNIEELAKAAEMIERLPADKYNHVERPYFESCLGKHLRHILDHYLCFIRDLNTGTINYEQRDRNTQLETDKEYALSIIEEIQKQLIAIPQVLINTGQLSVLLCSDVDMPEGLATQSSVNRELQFLHGHTVHHFAIIAAMLRFYGLSAETGFGVAPSTILHQETVKASA